MTQDDTFKMLRGWTKEEIIQEYDEMSQEKEAALRRSHPEWFADQADPAFTEQFYLAHGTTYEKFRKAWL